MWRLLTSRDSVTPLIAQAQGLRLQIYLSKPALSLEDPEGDLFSSAIFQIAILPEFIMAVVALPKWRATTGTTAPALVVVTTQAQIGSMGVENRERTREYVGRA